MPPLSRMSVAVRRLLARRPWIHWLVVTVACGATAATLLERADRIDAARRSWGTTRAVLVAAADATPGQPLIVVRHDLPEAVVPASAVDVDRADDGLVARQHLGAGEVVTAADVAAPGPLALVPRGWLVVAVIESPGSGAAVGGRVQVVSGGIVLSPEAVVVAYNEQATLVAVPADVAPMVPAAAAADGVALLLAP